MDDIERVIASDPKVQAISTDARLLSELVDNPGWQRLRSRALAVREEYKFNLGRRLLNGEEVSQREIDFHRGFMSAIEWMTGTPEKAVESFEEAVRRAYNMVMLEQLVGDDESPPYT